MFVLVRHAHAGDKRNWKGNDAARPLSSLGLVQSRGLVGAVCGVPIRGLLSSPTVRCRQTLEPWTATYRLPIVDHLLLAKEAPIEDLFELLTAPMIDGMALCTHGEVLDALAALARQRCSSELPPTTNTAKGSAWIIDSAAAPEQRFRYLAPAAG